MRLGKFQIWPNIPYETGSYRPAILMQMQRYLFCTVHPLKPIPIPILFNRFHTTFYICLFIVLFAVMIRIDKEKITNILCFSAERGEKPKPSREGKLSKAIVHDFSSP